MKKFNQFIYEDVLSNQVGNIAEPATKPDMGKTLDEFKQKINTFVNKVKVSNTGTTTQQQSDVLTMKMQNFRAGQAIDIKLKPDIDIKAQVEASGKLKYCKLLKSNIEEITLLMTNQQQQPSTLVDKNEQPIKSEQKPVYFRTFPDKKNKSLTWFYFYNNTEFIANPKVKGVFSKPYSILSIE